MPTEIFEKPNILFEMKGGLFPLMTVCILGTDLNAFEHQLKDKIQQAPNFFQHAPVIIDVKALTLQNISIDLSQLKAILQRNHLVPVGLRHANPALQAAADAEGLAVLKESSTSNKINGTSLSDDSPISPHTPSIRIEYQSQKSKVITEPVLIILSSVSNGAEILADGHIHIYGTLRGRALAGLNGQKDARIFCHCLEAELISISGQYKVCEDIEGQYWQKTVVVSCKEDHLHICLL